jgi:hypothetical protein
MKLSEREKKILRTIAENQPDEEWGLNRRYLTKLLAEEKDIHVWTKKGAIEHVMKTVESPEARSLFVTLINAQRENRVETISHKHSARVLYAVRELEKKGLVKGIGREELGAFIKLLKEKTGENWFHEKYTERVALTNKGKEEVKKQRARALQDAYVLRNLIELKIPPIVLYDQKWFLRNVHGIAHAVVLVDHTEEMFVSVDPSLAEKYFFRLSKTDFDEAWGHKKNATVIIYPKSYRIKIKTRPARTLNYYVERGKKVE